MKALSIRISAGIVGLAALIYILACGSPSGNVNQNQNLAVNSRTENSDLEQCKEHLNPATHAANLRDRLKNAIASSEIANNLKPDPASPDGYFTVDVTQTAPNKYFEAYIKGEVRGDDNLKILSDILNNYQDDEGDCLRVVYFREAGAANVPGGFKWSSCQYPMRVCPDGTCCDTKDDPAPSPSPSPSPNPLATTNANAARKGNTNN